jgi:hypothetical protein
MTVKAPPRPTRRDALGGEIGTVKGDGSTPTGRTVAHHTYNGNVRTASDRVELDAFPGDEEFVPGPSGLSADAGGQVTFGVRPVTV